MASKAQTTIQALKNQPHQASAFSVGTPVPQTSAAGTPVAATDLATALTLVNFLRTTLLANGIVA